jgi:hypothetical protein
MHRNALPKQEFFVTWDNFNRKDPTNYKRCLGKARNEKNMQEFLEAHPYLLVMHLDGHHGKWVIPHQRLGSEYVPDFLIGSKDSMGFWWIAVELESPTSPIFIKSGDPSKALNHAIRQILDWRVWLKKNQNYAERSWAKGGLGLVDIDGDIPGLILIGRRNMVDPTTNERRRQFVQDLGIEIHTYDWLMNKPSDRIEALESSRTKGLTKID